jgi:hypothetical protein
VKNELVRRRIAAAGAMAALGGALGYAAGRAYFYLVVGSHGSIIVLREARVNFHLALVIASFVALSFGLITAELARTEERLSNVERWLARGALPAMLGLAALMFVWP